MSRGDGTLVDKEHVFRFSEGDCLSNFLRKPEGRLLVVVAVLNVLFALALFGQASEYVYDEGLVPLLMLFCVLPTLIYFLVVFVAGKFRLGRWVFLLLFAATSLNFFTEDGGFPLYWIGGVTFSAAYWLITMRWKAEPVYATQRQPPKQASYVGAWLLSGILAGATYSAIVGTRYFEMSELVVLFVLGVATNIAFSLLVYSFFSQLRLYLVMPYLWGLGLIGVVLTSAIVLGSNQINNPAVAGYVAAEALIAYTAHNLAFYFFFKSKGRMNRQLEYLGGALSKLNKRNTIEAFD